MLVVAGVLVALCSIALFDRLQRRHPLRRVYPVIGRFPTLVTRWITARMAAGPEEGPYSTHELQEIRKRALTGTSMSSFGTTTRRHAVSLSVDVPLIPAVPEKTRGVDVMSSSGDLREIAVLNFGAMGFGPVTANTIRAVASAAAEVGCHQNTGEEGVVDLFPAERANLVWQVGTGYWGCRNSDGSFSEEAFRERASSPNVDCIEVKLSQGGKPGAGGFLPATKNTKRVAHLLGVTPGRDLISPPAHSAFNSVETMLEFVQHLGQMCPEKPVGIKLCIGSINSARKLAVAISTTGISPAFITVDGGDGGTGAGIPELLRFAALPAESAVVILDRQLREMGHRSNLRLFASGGIKDGFDLFKMICLGADACFFTRAPLVAIGCVQARLCHVGTCPSGIATQSAWRRTAVHPHTQSVQLVNYYRTIMDGFTQLMRACGKRTLSELNPDCLITDNGHSLRRYLDE